MVAMGSSLADRAWSRESAVFRITGVLTVVGGWFLTAGVAFTACFLMATLMNFGGMPAIVILVALAVYAIIHSQRRYAKKQKEEKNGDLLFTEMLTTHDRSAIVPMLSRHLDVSTGEALHTYAGALRETVDGLKTENLRGLRRNARLLERMGREMKNLRRRETICLRRTDGIKDYTDHLYESIDGDLSGLNICIDCANGASAAVARQLFPRLGAKCTFIGVEPDGKNINAGVGSTHLDNLEKAVVEGGFDCGIAFDGDADRCLACDEKGQEIDGDKIIALLAMNMKEKGCLDGNTAVVTVMSNLGFIKFMESQGIRTEKTAVGDRYVLENMRENGYAIGGEQSGHVILLHHTTTGDGELTAGKLLKLLAKSGKKMSELNGIYAQYPQVLVNVAANAAQKAAYKEDKVLADFIENEQQKLMDMGRVLVRVSGTEPKIRVMVEGQDLEAIDLCAKRIVDKINERIIEG